MIGFLLILIGFGVIVGSYIGIQNISYLKENVLYYATHFQDSSYNYIFIHFTFLVFCTITSFIFIGVPLLCTIIFYEGMSIGFLLSIFTATYSIKGFLYALILIFITKMVYLFILIFIFSKTLLIARKRIGKYLYKTNPNQLILKLVKGCFVLTIILLIYDIFLFFYGKNILQLFQFLLN